LGYVRGRAHQSQARAFAPLYVRVDELWFVSYRADFRQIMWRKFLRNLCQDSTMTQKVLPHNVAWPFLPFLPVRCCPLSAAILCGRKSLMALQVAPMLTQRVLPDNV